MSTDGNQRKHLINCIVSGGVREDHDVDIIRKIKMINVISLVGIANLIPLGVSALMKGNPGLGFFDFFVALILSANQVHLRTTGSYKWSVYSGVALTGGLFFYLFSTGGVDHSGHLWFYTFPLFCFFLLGIKKGIIATFALLALSLLVLSQDDSFQSMNLYTTRFKIRFVASLMVVLIYAYFFESTRKVAQEALTVKNTELKQKIVEEKLTAKALNCAMEDAKNANRAKSEFLANMSHELRTPLNHIIGFTELVVDKNYGDLNDTQEEYLNDVLNSSKHLLSLINDILDLAKVEARKLELEHSDVVLKPLLENSLTMVKEKALKHGIKLLTNIDGIPETIRADERKLKQIVYNLLSNAMKFTPDDGSITLSAKRGTAYSVMENRNAREQISDPYPMPNAHRNVVQISIKDTGIGLSPGDIDKIFNPFEQADGSSMRNYEGTGLGLSLTKSLVELHGGKIWVESEGQGKGAVFSFILPIKIS